MRQFLTEQRTFLVLLAKIFSTHALIGLNLWASVSHWPSIIQLLLQIALTSVLLTWLIYGIYLGWRTSDGYVDHDPR